MSLGREASRSPSPKFGLQQFSQESREHAEAESMLSRGIAVPEECRKKAGSQFEINEKTTEEERRSGNIKSMCHELC